MNQFSATLQGQLNWTGPSASGAEKSMTLQGKSEEILCTWVKTGRFGLFFVLCFRALGGHCLQMLCLPGCGTHANTQNLPHVRAFPASIRELSPPKRLFFSGVAPANQTKERVKTKSSYEFALFCEFWCFSLGKQAPFTFRNLVPECPCEKFMNLGVSLVWFAGATPDFHGANARLPNHPGFALPQRYILSKRVACCQGRAVPGDLTASP